MCSLNDDEFDDKLQENKYSGNNEIPDGIQCQKCNDNQATIKLRGKDVYCESCFQINITHKFRATLGKSKIVRPNDKVLVAHSGNGKSTALLHLIKAGMSESVHKRLMFQTQALHVDEGMIGSQSIEERQSMIGDIERQVQTLGFETFVVSLSESLDENEFEKIDEIQHYSCSTSSCNDERLIEIFENLSCDTAREDLLKKLRTRVIIKAAKLLGCSKIFVADDSSSLSVCILANVSLGRGAQLPLDVGFTDNRYGNDVMIMRPLRDLTRHEVNCYLNIHNLEIIESQTTLTSNLHRSIRRLTEHFVTDLDSQFNGTVSTIFRVSEKVSAGATNTMEDMEICILCNAPLDTSNFNDTTSAIDAIAFSKLVSSGVMKNAAISDVNNCDDSVYKCSVQDSYTNNCCGGCGDDDSDNMAGKQNNVSIKNISQHLCYGCRLIFHGDFKRELFPKFLINAAHEQLCLRTMRKQIKNFLL